MNAHHDDITERLDAMVAMVKGASCAAEAQTLAGMLGSVLAEIRQIDEQIPLTRRCPTCQGTLFFEPPYGPWERGGEWVCISCGRVPGQIAVQAPSLVGSPMSRKGARL